MIEKEETSQWVKPSKNGVGEVVTRKCVNKTAVYVCRIVMVPRCEASLFSLQECLQRVWISKLLEIVQFLKRGKKPCFLVLF